MDKRSGGAAARLNEWRENWLNPRNDDGSPGLPPDKLKKRTLTNLYNQRPTWLELAHLELDRAVLAAYGWPEEWAEKLQPNRNPAGKVTLDTPVTQGVLPPASERSSPGVSRVNPILSVADPAVEQEVLGRLLALNLGMASR